MTPIAPTELAAPPTGKSQITRLNEWRTEVAEATKDLTDAEREALIACWAAEVEAGLVNHVVNSREKSDQAD